VVAREREREGILRILLRKHGELQEPGISAIDDWQCKVGTFRRMVRGWTVNVIAELNKQKQSMAVEYNWLDLEVENREMDIREKARMRALGKELDEIWALEKIKVKRRSRDRMILERDRNIGYFHAMDNHRNRKKKIENLKGPNGVMQDT
jgi:hypothetical protein